MQPIPWVKPPSSSTHEGVPTSWLGPSPGGGLHFDLTSVEDEQSCFVLLFNTEKHRDFSGGPAGGQDSKLPLRGPQVQPLVRELGSHMTQIN